MERFQYKDQNDFIVAKMFPATSNRDPVFHTPFPLSKRPPIINGIKRKANRSGHDILHQTFLVDQIQNKIIPLNIVINPLYFFIFMKRISTFQTRTPCLCDAIFYLDIGTELNYSATVKDDLNPIPTFELTDNPQIRFKRDQDTIGMNGTRASCFQESGRTSCRTIKHCKGGNYAGHDEKHDGRYVEEHGHDEKFRFRQEIRSDERFQRRQDRASGS